MLLTIEITKLIISKSISIGLTIYWLTLFFFIRFSKMSKAVSHVGLARISKAKSLHDLVRKPYKGTVKVPDQSPLDKVCLLLMGHPTGLTLNNIIFQTGITSCQLDHVIFTIDNDPFLTLKRNRKGRAYLYSM